MVGCGFSSFYLVRGEKKTVFVWLPSAISIPGDEQNYAYISGNGSKGKLKQKTKGKREKAFTEEIKEASTVDTTLLSLEAIILFPASPSAFLPPFLNICAAEVSTFLFSLPLSYHYYPVKVEKPMTPKVKSSRSSVIL